MGLLKQERGGFRGIAALCGLAIMSLLAGCGAENENLSARSAVDVESQSLGSASLAAYPPGQGPEVAATEEVAIGVDTNHYEDTDPSALTDFRQPLAPYGTWEDTPTYGTVWIPAAAVVGPDFVPYGTAGHWTYDGSWVWVSDYEWGWAPFHYGRWVLIPGRGWAWIPGRAYSGAWVTWSFGPTYVGWAPLAPSWYWYDGYPVGVHVWYGPPHYLYCTHRDIFAPNVSTVVVHGAAASAAAASTHPYVPAQPSVGGPSRVPATPTVNAEAGGRVAAAPTVGPTPGELGHPLASAPKPPVAGNLAKAKAFATPAEAVRAGASAPASGHGFVAAPGGAPRYAPSERDALAGRAIGGRSNVGRAVGPNAPSGGARGYEGSRTYGSAPISRPTQTLGGPVYAPPMRAPVSPSVPVIRSPYGQTAPVYRAPVPSQPSAPVYRPSPTPVPSQPSAPVYRPSYRPSPAPSMPSAPIYRPSPSPAPVYRPSPSAPVFRPSAPPPVRAPSAPVVRPSTPAPAPAPRPTRGAVRR